MGKRPLLSIGMIFKNEIRCLERCMESLLPLREAVPCELIMADTGSTDGSREIAEKYADTLFDLPWTGDFAAARNAVLERCTGRWYMGIDADEWLDKDIRQLLSFLRQGEKLGMTYGFPTIRNYLSDDDSEYSDAYIGRIALMSAHPRYTGAIHESLSVAKAGKKTADVLARMIFHHDGYRNLNTSAQADKRARNMSMLRAELEKDPDDLTRLLQFIESGQMEEDYDATLRRAVALVEERAPGWERIGPPIYRYAVMSAYGRNFPELDDWIARAEELFPDSSFTRIDVAQIAFDHSWARKDHEDCLRRGERCLEAIEEYQAGEGDQRAKLISTVLMAYEGNVQHLKLLMAGACVELGRLEQARAILEGVDAPAMKAEHAGDLAIVLQQLHSLTEWDDGPLLARLWAELNAPRPTEARAKERREAFLKRAAQTFSAPYLAREAQDGTPRHAYSLYAPLAGECEAGTAAAILAAGSVSEIEKLLSGVTNWTALPAVALEKALLAGACFPLPERPLDLEEMDALASGLTRDQGTLYRLLNAAVEEDYAGSWQTLAWVRALALAAVQTFDWKTGAQEGLALARTFAKAEGTFLTGCYTPEVLREGNLRVLPPMHRFGWYCAQAFDALDAGDPAGYARLLRAGLETDLAMKPMVEYLTENTPELQAPKPSPELLALAEKVRTLLAAYDPDDPAVAALKQSEAYQGVAHLIEGSGV